MSVCIWIHTYDVTTGACRVQKSMVDSLELKLQAVVSLLSGGWEPNSGPVRALFAGAPAFKPSVSTQLHLTGKCNFYSKHFILHFFFQMRK